MIVLKRKISCPLLGIGFFLSWSEREGIVYKPTAISLLVDGSISEL